jgi:hypothetical protein
LNGNGDRVNRPKAITGALLKERHIQKALTDYLIADGWRPIRTEHAVERNERGGFKRKVGEVAMPDYLYIRYTNPDPGLTNPRRDDAFFLVDAEVMWIEFKRPGERPTAAQLTWHQAERKRGALVLAVDDIDKFREWYSGSGLKRR